nr:hypothetical protein [Tanacetum cinerariifolium]
MLIPYNQDFRYSDLFDLEDVKSAFLYGTIEEEVYVCQPPGFEDLDYPDKVYKVVKVLYGLHQAPRAWGTHILFGSSSKAEERWIFISQDKYVAEILRKFGLTDRKSASTLIDTEKPLLKDPDGEDVDVHTYRSMIGSLMYLTSSRPDIMFAVCACAHFQVTPKASHLHAVKRIFRYLKDKPHLGLWYLKDLLFDLMAYLDSDYAGASLDRKSTTGGSTVHKCYGFRINCWIIEGIECLPNDEIFTELARMGYEKHSTKLIFYKAFFSSQWKFLIHIILQCMSAKRTSWNEFSSSMASDVICLSIGDLSSHSTKYTSPALTQKVFANMRRVGKGFFGVVTSLFEGMLLAQEVGEDADEVHAEDVNAAGVIAEGGIIANIDADGDVVLEDAKDVVVEKFGDVNESADIQGRTAESQAQIYQIDLEHTDKVLITAGSTTLTTAPSAAKRRKGVVIRDPQETTTPSTIIHFEAKSKDKGKGILVEEPKPLKKKAQIKQDEKYTRELEAELNKNIYWDEVIDHVQRKQKEDKAVKIYQILKRKPQTEAQARKNMMIYLRNFVGFKMDYFKRMTYDDIRLIFEKHFDSNVAFLQKTKEQMDEEDSRALKRMNESQEDKAAKKQKLDEEVEELKRHLQIVPNDEDDVYTEATPLALKVPIVDYEIYNENNKPYYKIKRADERRYPLIRLTLDQMLNNVQLKVEEESEVSLELLSFGVDAAEELKEKHAK